MIDRLEAAIALAREAFEEARTGAVHVSDEELLAGVELAQRLANVAAGVQAVRVAQFASREHVQAPTGEWVSRDLGLGHVAESADCEIGTAIGLSTARASALTHRSAKIAAHLPRTLTAMGDGRLDTWRASLPLCDAVINTRV